MRAALFLMCLAAVLLPGCAAPVAVNSAATDVATAADSATAPPAPPTLEPTATPTSTASPMTTATPTPAATAAPTGTPTPAPTPELTPSPTARPQTKRPAATAKPASEHEQAVVVIASGYTATVYFLERDAGAAWKKLVETKGCVGKNGITGDKREGDRKTPKGVYALSFAFGLEKPETMMKFRSVTGESYWVDDPDSEYYNTWQEGYKGWESAEKLSDYPGYYDCAVAIAYNTKRVPGKGSAIFLHCKMKAYTSGCVAVPKSALLEMLKALDPGKKPVIIIAGSKRAAEGYGIVDFP